MHHRQLIHYFGLVLAGLILSSCATLPPVSPEAFPVFTIIENGAYHEPSGVDVNTANRWSHAAYKGSGNDNLVGMIGTLVSSSIAYGQQTDFRERNARYFPVIRRRMTSALPNALQASILSTSAPRLRPGQGESMRIRVQNFGLIRTGLNRRDEVLLAPAFRIQVQHLDARRELKRAWDLNSPKPKRGHTMVDLLSRLGLLEAEIRHTAAQTAKQIP